MLINGEKWACEACVRGHRVSNCQHQDRPLQHINKKGRPVSQCTHCRQMRKSRTAHVKCDCGEKTSKCAHLQQTVEGHKETCCCNHGGRCTCCHKKEPALDTVPETDSENESQIKVRNARTKSISRRRRANTVHSDAMLSFDQDGNRIASGKHSRTSSKSTTPYQLSRVNSVTSASSMGAGTESMLQRFGGGRGSSFERLVKSEATSPLLSPTGFRSNGDLPPLDLSAIRDYTYGGNGWSEPFGRGIPADNDGPMFSAGLDSNPVDWANYSFGDLNGDAFAPSSYSQTGTQSFGGLFDFSSGSEQLPHLANTTSTSGDVSEVEDFMPGPEAEFDGFDIGANGFYRQNAVTTNANAVDISSIDYDSFYKGPDSSGMVGGAISMVEEDPAFFMPDYNQPLAAVDENIDPLAPAADVNSVWGL